MASNLDHKADISEDYGRTGPHRHGVNLPLYAAQASNRGVVLMNNTGRRVRIDNISVAAPVPLQNEVPGGGSGS